jgi:hypothetical protein
MKEQKRVASFGLTDAGYQALLTLERKTKKTRKEVVSTALESLMGKAMDQTTVTFGLPNPEEIMMLRTEILILETSADEILKAIFKVRSKDKDQAKELAAIIVQLHDLVASFQAADHIFKGKQKLLKELTPADYQKIPKLIAMAETSKEAAKGKPNEASRTANSELVIKLLRIIG